MPRGGHNAKPTALKELEGNPGKRPINKNEPKPRVGLPEMPKNLPFAAQREWHVFGPELVRLGLLTVADGKAFGAYCVAYAHWEMLQAAVATAAQKWPEFGGYLIDEPIVNKDGNIVGEKWKANPLFAQQDKAARTMSVLLAPFGMTPASRGKLTVGKSNGADDGDEAAMSAHFDNPTTEQTADVFADLPVDALKI
jgi:P27 family predicted phage terminase small subunit